MTRLGYIYDIWETPYTPVEWRKTGDVEVVLGYPWPARRGGLKVIVTEQLAAYFCQHNKRGETLNLPIGKTTIKRVRKLLGLTVDTWWLEREHDLAMLTGSAFVAKHGGAESAACQARQRYLGISRQRQDGWWQREPERSILLSDAPRAMIADELDISVGAVGRLRWILKEKNSHE